MKGIMITLLALNTAYAVRAPNSVSDKVNKYIDTLKSECSVRVTSEKRTKEYNDRIGGAKNSLHLTDEAIDFVVPKECRLRAVELARELSVTVILYKVHIHVDSRNYSCMVRTSNGYRFCSKDEAGE